MKTVTQKHSVTHTYIATTYTYRRITIIIVFNQLWLCGKSKVLSLMQILGITWLPFGKIVVLPQYGWSFSNVVAVQSIKS